MFNLELTIFPLRYITNTNTFLDLLNADIIGVNHDVSIVVYWISDSKYIEMLLLTLCPSNIICSPSEGEVIFAMF